MVVVKQSNTKRRLKKRRLESVKVNLPRNVENETCECENIYLLGKCIFYLGYFNTKFVIGK